MARPWSKIDEIAQELAIAAVMQFRAAEALKGWEVLKKYYMAGPPKFNDFARENARTIEDKLTFFLTSIAESAGAAKEPANHEQDSLTNKEHFRRSMEQNRQTELLLIEKMLRNHGTITVGLLSPMSLYLNRMESDGVVREVDRDSPGNQITYELVESAQNLYQDNS